MPYRVLMRPATGTHNLYRLRQILGLQQKQFAGMIHLSRSLLQKLENEDRPLSRRQAEIIAAATGVSADWLWRNDPSEEPTDLWGKPYSKERYLRSKALGFDPFLDYAPPVVVRVALLQSYAKARDLFL